MNRRYSASAALAVVCLALSSIVAAESPFTLSLAVGAFDADTDDSDGPHLNELSYNAILGYEWSRYLALDAEFFHIESDSDFSVFGERSAFAGQAIGLSVRLQWPLADDFHLFLRAGAASFRLSEAELLDEALDDTWHQPMYGAGIRGKHWFVEYVSYGEQDDLYVEQLRGGLVVRF
ncbi:MAG: outer membrane beta-barrel protein [Pseudomonadota bacterium]